MSFEKEYEFDEMSRRPLYRDVTQKLVGLCPLEAGATIVDVGCGSGLATALLLERYANVGSVIGIDPSEAELEIARRRVGDPRVRFLAGRAQDVENAAGQVDATILSNVLHQIPVGEREPVLLACHQILKSGGRCALNTLFYEGAVPIETVPFYIRWLAETNAFLRKRGRAIAQQTRKPVALELLSPKQHEEMLQRAGFREVHVEEVTYGWTVDDWKALSSYSVFIEGATGLTDDLALGAEALKAALDTTYTAIQIVTLPRKWLFACAIKE